MNDMASVPHYISHRIEIDEYHRMVAASVFEPGAHIELLDGVLIERVGPMNPPHAGTITIVTRLLTKALFEQADVRTQLPITAGSASELQPDVALVAFEPGRYTRRHPSATDVHLLVEVCDRTREEDQRRKLPLYAREGVPEVWLVDLVADCVRTYRRPEAGTFRESRRFERGERLYPLAFDTTVFEVIDLLPPR